MRAESVIAGAIGAQFAFEKRQRVDAELSRIEVAMTIDRCAESLEPAVASHATEGHVGAKPPRLSREADTGKLRLQFVMQIGECRALGLDADPQDARSPKMWETSHVAQPAARWLRGASDPAHGLVDRSQVSCIDVPQELQGQVHRHGASPTYVGLRSAEIGNHSLESLLDVIRQIYGGKQAHGNDQDSFVIGSRQDRVS